MKIKAKQKPLKQYDISLVFELQLLLMVAHQTDIMPKPPWRDRKLQYLEKLRHASPEVLRVSMADKLHNARSILADTDQHGAILLIENRCTPKTPKLNDG